MQPKSHTLSRCRSTQPSQFRTYDQPVDDGEPRLVQVPEPPVLEQPDGEHGEGQEEAVDEQAQAVQPVQHRLLLVDVHLWREEVLL